MRGDKYLPEAIRQGNQRGGMHALTEDEKKALVELANNP